MGPIIRGDGRRSGAVPNTFPFIWSAPPLWLCNTWPPRRAVASVGAVGPPAASRFQSHGPRCAKQSWPIAATDIYSRFGPRLMKNSVSLPLSRSLLRGKAPSLPPGHPFSLALSSIMCMSSSYISLLCLGRDLSLFLSLWYLERGSSGSATIVDSVVSEESLGSVTVMVSISII